MKLKTTKFLILIMVLNLCAGVGYYLLFDHIKKETENTSVLMAKINLGQESSNRLSSLQTIIKDTEAERQQLSALLLPAGSEVAFIEQVENLAKSIGLTEKTNSISEAPGQTDIVKLLQIQLTVTGSFADVMYFLGQLENLPYDISIKNVSLRQQSFDSVKKFNLWTEALDISIVESL